MAGVTPPKTSSDIAAAGGRHYKGRGLGTLQAWRCPACGQEQGGRFESGCVKCGAGAPGVQVRKADEGGASPASPPRPAPRSPGARMADQLRQRAPAIDYDEIERRVARALESRLGGGYTPHERVLLYQALEAFLWLIDNHEIELPAGQTAEQVRTLAQKVAPDEGLEAETDGNTERTTTPEDGEREQAGSNAGELGEYVDPGNPEFDDTYRAIRERARAADLPSAPQQAPPQFFDPDLGGDEGGEDDPDRDGGGVPV